MVHQGDTVAEFTHEVFLRHPFRQFQSSVRTVLLRQSSSSLTVVFVTKPPRLHSASVQLHRSSSCESGLTCQVTICVHIHGLRNVTMSIKHFALWNSFQVLSQNVSLSSRLYWTSARSWHMYSNFPTSVLCTTRLSSSSSIWNSHAMATCGWIKKSTKTITQWSNSHNGGHDLQRIVDLNGRILVWCRRCSGYSGVQLVRKLLNTCEPSVEEDRINLCGRRCGGSLGFWRFWCGAARRTVISYARKTSQFSKRGPSCMLFAMLRIVATFTVARLILETRKLWLVGVATDRLPRYF